MTDVSAGFRPPCWCPCIWAPTWRLHTNLYKFAENVSPHIFHKKNCCDLNLGESLCISTFFLFPVSGLNLLNAFDFFILIYFEWRDTENQQLKLGEFWFILQRNIYHQFHITGAAGIFSPTKFCFRQKIATLFFIYTRILFSRSWLNILTFLPLLG